MVSLTPTRSFLFFCHFSFKNEDVPQMEFMYLVFTRMPGESYSRPIMSFVVVLVLRTSIAD